MLFAFVNNFYVIFGSHFPLLEYSQRTYILFFHLKSSSPLLKCPDPRSPLATLIHITPAFWGL